ncbi:MAG: O-antigen ligase family protein [Alphaproteobacteria bacterium]
MLGTGVRQDGKEDRGARIFALIGLVLFSEGFFNVLVGPAATADDAAFLRFVWPPLYLATLVAVLRRRREVAATVRHNWLLVVVVGLCLASTLWSVDAGTTARRSVAVAFTTLFGLWFAVRFDPRERLLLLARAFAVLAVGSALIALGLPQYGVMQEIHPGAWNGAFPQKNKFGAMMVYGASIFTVIAVTMPSLRRRALAGAAFCCILVLLSTSITSLLALLLALAVILSATVILRRPVLAVLAIYGSLMVAAALTIGLALDADAVFRMIGRDATMTGRTEIRAPLWERLATRPWTGFGYGAFWHDPDGPAWVLRRMLQWDVPSAHNGWVELWLDIGLGGVVLFGITFLIATVRAVAGAARGIDPETLWTLVFLTLFLLFSISESSIMRQNNLVWVIYVAAVATYRWRPEAAQSRPPPRITWPDRRPDRRPAQEAAGTLPAEPR